MATTSMRAPSAGVPVSRRVGPFLREALARLGVTGVGLVALAIFLLPLAYILSTAFKLDSQMTTIDAPLWPADASTYNYKGTDYPLYNVKMPDGTTRKVALVSPYREDSDVIDPAHPEQGVFNVKGRWRTWQPVYHVALKIQNFIDVWDQVNFLRLFRNSILLAGISTIGTLIACILVA
ncbi:MAG TPA: hypothetical protein VF784_08635, partial [Anaerolineales bacterium]